MEAEERVFTVGDISRIISGVMDAPELQGIFLRGEIISKNIRGGHVYMDLSDPDDTSLRKPLIRCIIWRSIAAGIRVPYSIGDVVTVRGGLNYYAPSSSVSFVIQRLSVDLNGEGKALMQKIRLLKKLDSMGLLAPERKRPIPRYISKLAIVSSEEAAGYHDMLDTLSRRYPCQEVKLFPAIVQGARAPESIEKALDAAYRWKPDAIILGRGGGSKSDLSCFDDERVAMAISRSPAPLITAIGHQIDTSVADRLADVVAITPTDAASRINPSFEELDEEIGEMREALSSALGQRISRAMMGVMDLRGRLEKLLPQARISRMEKDVAIYRERLSSALRSSLDSARSRIALNRRSLISILNSSLDRASSFIEGARGQLSACSVESNLKRGYAIVTTGDGRIVRDSDLKPGASVNIRTLRSEVQAVVEKVTRGRNCHGNQKDWGEKGRGDDLRQHGGQGQGDPR